MSYRDQERAAAKAAAQKESINRNGMLQDASPVSTRIAAEARRTDAQPDPEPTPRDHSTAAGTTHVQYGGSVRSRLERTGGTDEPPQDVYPSNGTLEERQAFWVRYEARERRKS